MAFLLDSLIVTNTPQPPKMIVYGPPGVGKTTFAASAGAILIDCENGAGTIPGLRRTPYLDTWPKMRDWLTEVARQPSNDGSPLAVDTIDWMVRRIIEYVVLDMDTKSPNEVTNTIGSSHGGYFKARDIVVNVVYRELLPLLNAIANKGTAIILLAHAVNAKMTTPEGFNFRLASPDIPDWIVQTFIEWTDAVLYASNDNGNRTLLMEGTNVILAKNRYGLSGSIPLSWPAFANAVAATMGAAQ